MGRRKSKKGGRAGGGNARYDKVDIVKENERFERYYGELRLFSDDDDGAEAQAKGELWAALRRELPNSFRFTGSRGHALGSKTLLIDRYIPEIEAVQYNGERVTPPVPVAWYPDELAWYMTTPKTVVRKFAPFASFQKFLVSETSVGNISRQEVVSMIPPLLLAVEPGMAVLDMCAAPGSKTAQLIEMMHAGEEAGVRAARRRLDGAGLQHEKDEHQAGSDSAAVHTLSSGGGAGGGSDDGRATGLLVANDVDYKRAQMLVHQVKRLNSPNLLVMNHDATLLPSIRLPPAPAASPAAQRPHYLKFDRILADVPCSGDGTCRKNANIWRDWMPGNAIGLHVQQVRILTRALQMLKAGGTVVYSTCSMNPVEDEAVVASTIALVGGLSKVRLRDCRPALPALLRYPGLTSWKVMDKSGRMWDSWEHVKEAAAAGRDGGGAEKLIQSMFAPDQGSGEGRIPLENCMRVYAHQQDTSSFFIAVLDKLSEIRVRPEGVVKSLTSSALPNQTPTAVHDGSTDVTASADCTATLSSLHAGEGHVNGGSNTSIVDDTHDATIDKASATVDKDSVIVDDNAIIIDPTGPALDHTKKRSIDGEEATERSLKRRMTDVDSPTLPTPPSPDTDPTNEPKAEPEQHQQALPPQPPHLPPPASNAGLRMAMGRGGKQPFEEPFKYLPTQHGDIADIFRFYDLSARFPRDRFMVRNATGEPVKAIYYTSALVRDILGANEGRGMKFVHAGVKLFVKQDVQGRADVCRWRIQTEGIAILENWAGLQARTVRLRRRSTLRKLLVEMFPLLSRGGWIDLAEIGERVRDIGMGCCLLRVEASEGPDGFSESMVLPLWKSVSSLNLMLPKEERRAMLLRLYNEDVPLIDHSKNRFQRPDDSPPEIEMETNDEPELDGDEAEALGTGGAEDEADDDEAIVLDDKS